MRALMMTQRHRRRQRRQSGAAQLGRGLPPLPRFALPNVLPNIERARGRGKGRESNQNNIQLKTVPGRLVYEPLNYSAGRGN